jgi:hypothetical protein
MSAKEPKRQRPISTHDAARRESLRLSKQHNPANARKQSPKLRPEVRPNGHYLDIPGAGASTRSLMRTGWGLAAPHSTRRGPQDR